EDIQKILFLYGYYVGLSYQIIDDILDFVSTEEQLGKPAGGDLLQGNITLPVLFAMEDIHLREKIICVNEHTSKEDMQQLIDEMINSGVIEKSSAISERYLQKALQVIQPLPRGRAKTALYR